MSIRHSLICFILGGNTNTDFAVSATGVITVATGKTLAKATTPGYSLVYEAADNAATKLTGTLTIHVSVCECSNNGAQSVVAGLITALATLIGVMKLN